MEWIPTSERLPSERGEYLVTMKGKRYLPGLSNVFIAQWRQPEEMQMSLVTAKGRWANVNPTDILCRGQIISCFRPLVSRSFPCRSEVAKGCH